MTHINYGNIAEIYDAYVCSDFDFAFFRKELAEVSSPVLELTSGTGRLSLPLAESGADLTCVNRSADMLSVLSCKMEKIAAHAI